MPNILQTAIPMLCVGILTLGSSPITFAMAAKSSATIFSPEIDNPCTSSWQGPSADNTFDCDGDTVVEWMLSNRLWQFVIPLAIAILICCPGSCIVLCGRYLCGCCGGASKQRPGHLCCGGEELDDLTDGERARMYSRCCINVTKCWALFVAVMGVAGVALCIAGGVRIALGVNEISAAAEDMVNWFLQVIGEAQGDLKDPGTGSYPSGYDLGMFDEVANEIEDLKRTYFTDGLGQYRAAILAGSLSPAFVSVIPALLLFVPAFAALTNARRSLPTIAVIGAFPVQLIYFLAVTLILIVLIPVDIACADLESTPEEKSITQWYLIPYCEAESPFASIIENVNDMEADAAVEGCEKLLEICSTTAVWSAGDPQRLFYCNLTNANTECRTLDDIVSKVDSMVVKTGAPEDCSGNASGCTLRQCAISCTSTDARDNAAEAVDKLNTAQRVMKVFETVLLPWLDCRRLFDKLLGLGPRQMCSNIRGGFTHFKDGAIIIAAGAVVGMIVGMLGEKRFFDPNKYKDKEDVPPMNASTVELGSINQNSKGGLSMSQSASYRPSDRLLQLKEQYANGLHSPSARAARAAAQQQGISVSSSANPLTVGGKPQEEALFVLPEEASPSKPADSLVM